MTLVSNFQLVYSHIPFHRRADAVQILGSQFYLVAMEITGGNTTVTADVNDIKARATAAFTESVKKVIRF